mmetsp:Transcript_54199/g.131513  ORF Transcript_54199/g.131513 Transcript_54199/m.131513 type:complete len:82 (-) Transcript_54199:187-432(-)
MPSIVGNHHNNSHRKLLLLLLLQQQQQQLHQQRSPLSTRVCSLVHHFKVSLQVRLPNFITSNPICHETISFNHYYHINAAR